MDVITSEDGAGWTAFLRGLVARGLSGVRLVTSDAHEGLRAEKVLANRASPFLSLFFNRWRAAPRTSLALVPIVARQDHLAEAPE